MKPAVERVAAALRAAGVVGDVTEFAQSTRTAEEAATAVGATVGQIVKSLVFLAGDTPILALVSGANRADPELLAQITGATIHRADADAVRAATGYSIGGVPPIGHASPLRTFMDADLLRFDIIWAAAGTPNAVFPITPTDLQRITGAQVAEIAARA